MNSPSVELEAKLGSRGKDPHFPHNEHNDIVYPDRCGIEEFTDHPHHSCR